MSCVQLIQLSPSANLSTNTPEWRSLITTLKTADGAISTTWAIQEEDPKTAGIATHWKSLNLQKPWAASEQYEAVKELLKSITSAPLYEDVVVFTEDAAATLGAPVVELVSWIHPTSKIDTQREQKVAFGFSKFAEAITARASEAAGGLVGGWGQVEFDHEGISSRRFTALIGWKSVEAHYACKLTPPFLENIHYLMENDDSGVEMVHYKYSTSA